MKKRLVFATNNAHKLEEVQAILGAHYEVLSLKDIGCTEDIPETADTLEGNALLKAKFVKTNYAYDCFADDTGLEVYVLNNAPGVYSARYAGDEKDSGANRAKLLTELAGQTERSARFRTVIALLEGDREYLFEGVVEGNIITEEKGSGGFGYDSVFMPKNYSRTFAELGMDIKNKISHRAEATNKLKRFFDENV